MLFDPCMVDNHCDYTFNHYIFASLTWFEMWFVGLPVRSRVRLECEGEREVLAWSGTGLAVQPGNGRWWSDKTPVEATCTFAKASLGFWSSRPFLPSRCQCRACVLGSSTLPEERRGEDMTIPVSHMRWCISGYYFGECNCAHGLIQVLSVLVSSYCFKRGWWLKDQSILVVL